MLRNAPKQIQERQAYAVKDAVAARDQLDRAAYPVREIVERIRTGHEQHQWLVGMAAVALSSAAYTLVSLAVTLAGGRGHRVRPKDVLDSSTRAAP